MSLRNKKFLELKGDFKDHLIQLTCNEQGHPKLDQVAESPLQPDLECLQGQDIHQLSEQYVIVLHYPCCKKLLPYILSKSPLF